MMSPPLAGRPFTAGLPALLDRAVHLLARYGGPLLDLWIRLTMAPVFFRSGIQKLQDWPSTVYLFEYEYQVPVLPPGLAAALAAATEVTMPVLLVLGLATRLAAVPLLAMTLVIQFLVGSVNPAFNHPQHFFWMILLCSLIVRGGGALSLDHLLTRRLSARLGSTAS